MRTFCWCKNAFLQNKMLQMHLMQKCIFATRTFSKGKCSAYIFQRKMFSCAKMHLMQKCCVFCFAKNKDATLTFCWCKNAFLQTKMLESGKMHLMQKCIFAYIFLWKMFSVHFPLENVQRTFSKGKCSAPTKCYKCI